MEKSILKNDYAGALRASERVNWKLDEVLAEEAAFDFGQPFLPEAMAGTEALRFLSLAERRTLNQIRANGYLCLFGLVEEFILPYVLERLASRVDCAFPELLALLGFAGEEAKHIELFRRFQRVFARGFGHPCEVIGPPSAIREHVLGRGALGVGLLILHIEWMTQQHYLEWVRNDTSIEPSFGRLLHQHWLEECQHARIDGWIVDSVAAGASAEERALAFQEYVGLLEFLEAGIDAQVGLDLAALERACRRELAADERAQFRDVQARSQRRTFLGSGVAHPRVRAALESVHPEGRATLDALVRRLG